jgi:PKD repeat protein
LCKAHVLPYSSLDPGALPAVSFVAPGICNDQHGAAAGNPYLNCQTGSAALTKRGDDWLAAHVPSLLANDATVFITYDESGTLYAAEVGPGISANTTDDTAYTHYSVLAAIEQAYGLDKLNAAATATPIPLPPGPPPPPNQPPSANGTATCPTLSCTFDGTASVDPDGSVVSYAWDFGDGITGTGSVVPHEYATAGTYSWTLTVTDDDGASGQAVGSVKVSDPSSSTIQYVGSAGAVSGVKSPSVLVPATGHAGDLLVLAIDVNTSTVTVSPPTGVSNWIPLATADANGMKSQVWWKLGEPSDFGARVTVPLSSGVKSALHVMDYSGVNAAQPIDTFASATDTAATSSHSTPTVNASSGDWVLSLWSDKSSATTGWTVPGSVVPRVSTIGTGPVYISAVAADSGQAVGLAPYGGLTATTNQAGSKAVMWTIALESAT